MCKQLLKYVLLTLLLGVAFSSYSQRFGHFWTFGSNVAMDFNCDPPRLFRQGNLKASEGHACISNDCGDLMFYTDGDSVWNFGNTPFMGPPIPLNGSKFATQNTVILPNRSTPGDYTFFTVDDTMNPMSNGLCFSELTNASSGFGTWTIANKNLEKDVNEMVAAVDHANRKDYWVVVKKKGLSEFRSYRVTDTGVDTNAVVSLAGLSKREFGQMKFSPDGKFLVIARPLQVFKFDNTSGEIKDFADFSKEVFVGKGESIAFSASGKKLYVTNFGFTGMQAPLNGILQVNLEEPDPTIMINTTIGIGTSPFEPKGGMQLGPDGKIYVIETIDGLTLSRINLPEEVGTAAQIEHDIIQVPGKVGQFFPTFCQSFFLHSKPFNITQICSNDSAAFEVNISDWLGEIGNNKVDKVKWIFGDPTTGNSDTSALATPKHLYSKPGCFDVSLTLTSLGTDYTKVKRIRINQAPTLNLGPRDTSLCARPRIMTLFGSTTDNPDASYTWFFDTLGAPPHNPDLNPAIPISAAEFFRADIQGTYTLKKSWKCCDTWDTITIYFDSMVPQFKINDNLQCLMDNEFEFTNISKPSIKPGTTTWDFGPGGKATGEVVKVKFNQNGAFYPTMISESEKGCKGRVTRIVLVVKHPEARFFTDTTEQCANGNVFKIRDSSTIEFGQGGLQKWLFDMGDGYQTGLKQFSKSYANPGAYNVSLIVTSSQDCRDTARTTLRVYEQPKAGFTIDDTSQCRSANKFVIDDTSSSQLDSINYRMWTYGDGSPADDRTGLPLNFSRSYSTVDSFLLTLKVGTGIGCLDSAKHYVYVHGDPYVNFTIDSAKQCLDGNVFNFTDTTYTQKGFVQTYIWDFGDSTPTSNSGKNKTYQNYGGYNVQLRVITNKGCTDSVSKSVLVHPMPNASFTVNNSITCFKNHSFDFSSASSFIPVGTIQTYTWDFGDGSTSNQATPTPKVYTKDSAHRVLLILVSDKGCADTTQRVLQFYPTPVAEAKVNKPIQCIEENLFTFTADGSTANGGNIAEYLWQFGDGTIDLGKDPGGKFYVSPDSFKVVMQVTTDNNCTDTASVYVRLLPSPVANFTVPSTCLFQPSKFTNKSYSNPGSITNWNWQLGDGTTSTDSTPVHTYSNTGNYTVTLNVLSSFGCEATVTKVNEAVVKPLPQAKFDFIKTDFDEKNTTVQFVDSSIDANQWLWELGAGNFSTLQNPSVLYTDTATLPVTLIINNTEGCFDTITKSIFIAPDFFFYVPNAFTPNKDILNPTYGGEGTLYFKEYNLKIFNRWGQKVFESDSPLNRWDGTLDGKDCPEGLYTYIYLLRDVFGFYHNYKGQLTMFR